MNCTVLWASKKQQTVSLSSTESEYIALTIAVAEIIWLIKLLKDFEVLDFVEPVPLYEDNHLDIKFNFIKEKLDSGLLKLIHISTEHQLQNVNLRFLLKI